MRKDRENLTRQRDELAAAYEDLTRALALTATEAKTAGRLAARRSPQIALHQLYAAVRSVERAEQRVDMANFDLHTASGGDA